MDNYVDEWRATLEDPEKLKKFASFINAPDEADPSLAYVPVRGQIRPATAEERSNGAVLVAPARLEIRS